MKDDFTRSAREAKQRAWERGYAEGKRWAAQQTEIVADPYLQYLYLLGISQAIANHGRTLAGIDQGKSRYEPEARKNAAGTR